MVDPYQTLEVERGCSREDVTAAFRAKVWAAHPDRGGDEQSFIELCSAYKAHTQGSPAEEERAKAGAGDAHHASSEEAHARTNTHSKTPEEIWSHRRAAKVSGTGLETRPDPGRRRRSRRKAGTATRPCVEAGSDPHRRRRWGPALQSRRLTQSGTLTSSCGDQSVDHRRDVPGPRSSWQTRLLPLVFRTIISTAGSQKTAQAG